MPQLSFAAAVGLGTFAFLIMGCSGGAGGGALDGGSSGSAGTGAFGGFGGGSGGGSGDAAVTQGCDQPKSQSASAPCCLEYGLDACGAGLFSAAFDGRLQPTCYVDGSRLDRTEGNEDGQCVSGSCNLQTLECRSRPGTECESTTGCAAVGTQGYVCASDKCTASDGEGGDPCGSTADCKQGQCVGGKCLGTEGAACNPGTDSCAAGLCCDGYPTSTCGACGADHGEKCSPLPLPPPFGMPCKPGLLCCEHSSGAGTNYYCYPSC